MIRPLANESDKTQFDKAKCLHNFNINVSTQPLVSRASAHSPLTLGLSRGLSSASFLAAASIAEAAPSSSFSAITFGSSGFTHSEPGKEI